MNKRFPLAPLVLATLLAATCSLANAQNVRPKVTQLPTSNVTRAADHIVAVVNSEPITNQEVVARIERLEPPAKGSLPPRDELSKQVLERLIQEKTQIQWAAEIGIKVDDAALNDAEQNVARQNSLTVPQLRERLKTVGLTPDAFRANLRNEILLQRVREREVDNRVKVSEQDIDAYLDEQRRPGDPVQTSLNLGHILVQVPENASTATLATLQAKAEGLASRARGGENFAALAREFSDAPEGRSGGQLRLRNADRYPSLFVQATQSLRTGDVTGPVRSGAGFHILKVIEKRSSNLPVSLQVQTRARHILLRPSAQLSQDAAIAKLKEFKQNIRAGKATFEALARQFSQDGSASAGGDLGWAGPGQFVPEFEQVMNSLQPDQVSDPLVSRFGVHLIQVMERRQVEMSPREQREAVRNLLRERKAEETYENWARDLRARAYVEYREPPQ